MKKVCPICNQKVKIDRFLSRISFKTFYWCDNCNLLFNFDEFKEPFVLIISNGIDSWVKTFNTKRAFKNYKKYNDFKTNHIIFEKINC